MILVEKAKSIIAEATPVIESAYGIKLKPHRIEVSNRMTRCLGLATSNYVIKLSGVHFDGHEETTAYKGTVLHELSHLVEYQIKKQLSHSPFWKQIMLLLKQEPDRLFGIEKQQEIAYQRIERAKELFSHSCDCQTYMVKKSIHNNIIYGMKNYTCRLCNTMLT